MIRKSNAEAFRRAVSFEKEALNAQAARALAKKHGIVPEAGTQWRWALRNARKGKTPEQMGRAHPDAINEVWDHSTQTQNEMMGFTDAKGKMVGERYYGDGTTVSIPELSDAMMARGDAAIESGKWNDLTDSPFGAVRKRKFKEMGVVAAIRKQETQKLMASKGARGTIHNHPKDSAWAIKAERGVLEEAQKAKKESPHRSWMAPNFGLTGDKNVLPGVLDMRYGNARHNGFNRFSAGDRVPRMMNRMEDDAISSLSERHSRSSPIAYPSGTTNQMASLTGSGADLRLFQDAGRNTHHNVVSNKHVYTHSPRPKKGQPDRTRTVLWDREGYEPEKKKLPEPLTIALNKIKGLYGGS